MKAAYTLFFFSIFTLIGCASMNTPLIFDEHVISTPCFAASEMRVRYGTFVTSACANRSRAKRPEDDQQLWGTIGDFRAFNGPLQVQWKSSDGTPLSATINLDEVFPGKRVLHKEDPKNIAPTLPIFTTPVIVIEVNDKLLTIYMDIFVGLKTDEPGKLRKLSRNRLIAYQKSFD